MGAPVQWLNKVDCLESRRSRVRTPLWQSNFKETKCFFPAHSWRFSIVGSLCDREVACSASDLQGSNFESCVWSTVSSHSSHHPQEVLLAQFSLYVHKGGLKPDSFHFILLGIILMYKNNDNGEFSYSAHTMLCALHTYYPWSLDLFIHVPFQLPFWSIQHLQPFRR